MYRYDDVPLILKQYDPLDVRTWPYYTITIPLLRGDGPVSDCECDEITYAVWDVFCNSYGSYKNLPDAINEAMRLTHELTAAINSATNES